MPAKLKWFVIFILSILVTAGAGVYMNQRQPSTSGFATTNGQQQMSVTPSAQEIVAYAERASYKPIPLSNLKSALQGSDPATLALNAFGDMASEGKTRKVEVVYPQRNQALVTITQIKLQDKSLNAVRYRVEMATFGGSILVSSPPVWEIVWAGSHIQCWSEKGSNKNSPQTCD